MISLILTKLALAWDMSVVLGTVLLVRLMMTSSPMYNASAPQWAEERYWVAGVFGALTYALLAWAGRFYSRRKPASALRVPAINLANCAFLFLLGCLACWRYTDMFEGQYLFSKRVLFFSVLIVYALTTVVHYLVAVVLQKRRGAPAEVSGQVQAKGKVRG